MKLSLISSAVALAACSLIAADSNPKDDVKAAAKKLAEKANYSWKTTVDAGGGGGGGGGRFRPGPTDGKTEKDGATYLTMTRGENTTVAVIKGTKGAIKTQDGWQSLSEAAADDGGGQGFSPARFVARMVQNYKTPAVEAEDLAGKISEMKSSDGVLNGPLTEAGAKSLLSFGGRGGGGGGNGPDISGAKGSVKFWVHDGVLAKYEYNVQGTISFNGNDRDVNRTTTVEIKDVGTTKIELPDEAKKKMGAE